MQKIFIFLGLFWGACACGEAGKEKMLVGKWAIRFDQKACIAQMQKADKQIFQAQPEPQKQAILKEIAIQIERDSWIEFKADKTFEQVLLEGETKYTGKWQIKSGGTRLELTWNKATKTTESCNILLLDAQNLTLGTTDKNTPELAYKRYTKPKPKPKS